MAEAPDFEIEEAALDERQGGMRPRMLLNIITVLVVAGVLVATFAANFSRLFPPPPFHGQLIYVDFGDQIEALDARTGHVHWTAHRANELLAVGAGMLVGVQTVQGTGVFALDAATGAVRWDVQLGNAIPCVPASLLVADNLALVTCAASNIQGARTASGKPAEPAALAAVVALDLAHGGVRWRFQSRQASALTVAAAGNTILIGEQATENIPNLWLYTLDAGTGVAQWRSSAGGSITRLLYDPTSATVFAQANRLTSLAMSDGAVLWQRDLILADPPLVSQGTIFITTFTAQQPETLALDLRTGAQRWRFATPTFLPANPVITAAGYLIITSHSGSAAAVSLNAQNGVPRWQAAVANGTVIADAVSSTIFLNDGTTFTALDNQHGMVRWHLPLPAPLASVTAATIVTNTNVIITAGATLLAADITTGKVGWKLTLPAKLMVPPLLGRA